MIVPFGKGGLHIRDPYSPLLMVMALLSTVWYLSFALLGLWNGKALGEVVSGPDVSQSLQDILNKAHQGPLYTYPTSLTQGIVPVSWILPPDFEIRKAIANFYVDGIERDSFS